MPRSRSTAPSTALAVVPEPVATVSVPTGRRRASGALTAAGVNMASAPDTTASKLAAGAVWQEKAWAFYDSVGELHAGANWLGNALSRVRLYVADVDGEELEDGPAVDFLASLFGGETGQSQAQRTMGIHLTIPGETWIIGRAEVDDNGAVVGHEEWIVASHGEVKRRGSAWELDRGDGAIIRLDPAAGDVVLRIWRPHPRQWAQADSPVRSVLGVLSELLQLTKKIAANIDSRLAGAGILFLPNEMTFESPRNDEGQPIYDDFFDMLTELMMDAIEDQADASARVPLVVKAPGDVLQWVTHLKWDTDQSSEDRELREEAIKRLGLAMDMPVEILTGTGDVNHWGAWQIDESAIKIHIEPMMELICAAFTRELLRPFLRGGGTLSPAEQGYQIKADTSDLRLRQNRPEEAQALYELGGIKLEALLRENGFDEGDMPDDDERRLILLMKTAIGAVSPDMAVAALKDLGIDLDVQPEPAAVPAQQQPALAPVATTPEDTRVTPDEAQALAASGAPRLTLGREVVALNMAANLVCSRAIERGRNKLGKRGPRALTPIEPAKAAEVLSGELTHAPQVAAALGYCPEDLSQLLTSYCTQTLTDGGEMDDQLLHTLMERFVHRAVTA